MPLIHRFRALLVRVQIDHFVVLCFLLFLSISFLLNALQIPGDEPDFSARKFEYLHSYFFLLPEQFINILSNSVFDLKCIQTPFLYRPFGYLDFDRCHPNIKLAMVKTYISFLNTFPIWLLAIFRKNIFYCCASEDGIAALNLRLDAVMLLLIFPVMAYHFSFVSPESCALLFQALAFIFLGQFWLCLLSSLVSLFIDPGNGFIFALFLVYWALLSFLNRTISLKLLFIGMLILLIFAYTYNIQILVWLNDLLPFQSHKLSQLISLHQDGYYFHKYPIYYRFLNTILGLTLFTPAANKVFLSYGFMLIVAVFYIFRRVYRRDQARHLVDLPILASLSFCIAIECVLPAYSNAKYYLYTLFFVTYGLLGECSKYKILFFGTGLSVITIINLYLNFDHFYVVR